MKKLTAILLIVTVFASACKNDTGKKDAEKQATFEENLAEHYMTVYERSMKLNDGPSATSALNSYLTVLGDSLMYTSPYVDTLILLYQEMRQFSPVFLLSDEVLKVKPNDTNLLILNTGVAQLLGGLSQVSARCLQLSQMFPDQPIHKLNYAQSLIEQRKTEEGEKIYMEIINDPKSATQQVPFNTYDQNGQPKQNFVNARVGAFMKLGQLYELLNNNKQAEKYYRKALEVDGDFRPASAAILELKRRR